MKSFALLFAAAFAAPLASAHVSLEQTSAPAGSYQKLTFRIGHGCKGSPTTSLIVSLPAAVTGAKPMPKPGWTISLGAGAVDTPKGKTGADAVHEVSWSGGSLPDDYYDEFSMQVRLPDTPGKIYFKVAQLCAEGRWDWVQTPADGVEITAPAPMLEVLPAAPAADHHHH